MVALAGKTEAVSVSISPTMSVIAVVFNVTPATGSETVTLLTAVLPPSCVVAVIVVVPADTAVTTPLALTVATEGLLLRHVTL